MNKQRFLSELQKLLVFMTDEDRDLVIERLEEMFELAGPEGENGVIGMLGSATRTAIRLSRGYEPGYIPELPDMALFTGEPAQPEPEAEPEPETEAEYAAEDAAPAEEQAGDDLWSSIPAFELPDVEEDGFAPVPEAPPAPEAEPEDLPADVPEEETGPQDEPADAPEDMPEDTAPEDVPGPEDVPEAGPEDMPEEEPEDEPGELRYIEPRMVSHDVPEYGELSGELTPLRELPPRYMPLWVGVPLFIIAILALGVPLLPVVIVLFLVLLVPGALLLIAAWLIFVGGLWCVAYIADAVMIFGAAFIVLGLGLMALWLGLWLGVTVIKLYIRGIRALARVCFGRKEASRYA